MILIGMNSLIKLSTDNAERKWRFARKILWENVMAVLQ